MRFDRLVLFPARKVFDEAVGWRLGEPDLIVSTPEMLVKGDAPDWWGGIESVEIPGLTEDRYVASVEIREINNVKEIYEKQVDELKGNNYVNECRYGNHSQI